MQAGSAAVMATLEVEVEDPPGKLTPLKVEVFAPVPSQDDWACTYRFTGYPVCGSGTVHTRQIFGVDSWQAMMLAVKMARVELRFLDGYLRYCGERVSVAALFGEGEGNAAGGVGTDGTAEPTGP